MKKNTKTFLWLPGMLLLAALNAPPAGAQRKENALQGDLRVHDPSMIKAGNVYYVFSTGKGIRIKTSPDRIHWKNAGRVFSDSSLPRWHTRDIPDQDGNLWAPDILYRDGIYYLNYAVSAWMNFNSSIGLATNTTLDPEDPHYHWQDQGQVISYKNGGEGVNVIDPNAVADTDGRLWLVYGSYKAGVRLTPLNPATGKLLTDPPRIITLTSHLGEGSALIKGPGYYYLFVSTGRCCAGLKSTYHVVMGRAKTIEGPYLNKQGERMTDNHSSLLLEGDQEEPGRGGNSFFTEGDTTFIVYHAYTRSASGASLLNIRPLYIDETGWPTLRPTGRLFRRMVAAFR